MSKDLTLRKRYTSTILVPDGTIKLHPIGESITVMGVIIDLEE